MKGELYLLIVTKKQFQLVSTIEGVKRARREASTTPILVEVSYKYEPIPKPSQAFWESVALGLLEWTGAYKPVTQRIYTLRTAPQRPKARVTESSWTQEFIGTKEELLRWWNHEIYLILT
jgi:hypothetical protein